MTMILFHRPACHLCWEALELCREQNLSVEARDIDDELELGARYGLRIPVLQIGERELDWPFDARQLQAFVQPVGLASASP
jgi:glutaredoxin